MKTLFKGLGAIVLLAWVATPAQAQLRPGAFTTIQATSTSATAVTIGCAVGTTSGCTGGLIAGTAKFTTGIATDAATVPTHGIAMGSGVPSSTSFVLYNNSGTLTWNGTPLAAGSSLSGTTGTIPIFTAPNAVGDSTIVKSGTTYTATGTWNVTTAYQLNGTSINTGGTLTNVAYLDQANYFTNASGQRLIGGIALSNGVPTTHGIIIPNASPGSIITVLFNSGSELTWQGASASDVGISIGTSPGGNSAANLNFIGSNSANNWRARSSAGVFSLVPSTAGGGTTFTTAVMSLTTAGAVTFLSGITAGSGSVGIVDSTGKIPAISSTYFTSVAGTNLTGTAAGLSIGGNAATATSATTAATVTNATQAAITTVANVTTVGALNAGSITSGFGSIDVGADAISTTGTTTFGTQTTTASASGATAATFKLADSADAAMSRWCRNDLAVCAVIQYPGTSQIDIGTTTNHAFAFKTNNTVRGQFVAGGTLVIGKTSATFASDTLEAFGSTFGNDVFRATDSGVDLMTLVFTPALGSDTGTDVVVNAGGFLKLKTSRDEDKENINRDWSLSEEHRAKFMTVRGIQYDRKEGIEKNAVTGAVRKMSGVKGIVSLSATDIFNAGLPELVNLDENGKPFSIRTDGVQAFQQSFIIDHDARIAALEAEVTKLKEKP